MLRYDGTTWSKVGITGFTEDVGWFTNFAFSPTGQLYLAFQDWSESRKGSVMKYDSNHLGINEPQASWFLLYPDHALTNQVTIDTFVTHVQS